MAMKPARIVPELVTVPEPPKETPTPAAPVAEMRPLLINSAGKPLALRNRTAFVPPVMVPSLDTVALPPV